MFSEDAHYEFLKRYYRAEFFEGRNGSIWGINYSYNLARVGMNMLERYGYGIILKHESITGETIYYDRSLTILFGDRITQALGGQYCNREMGNDSNLLIVFYVQIMPDDLVMQLHRF
ncbi:hypothetical protein KAM645c_54900 (plasmid) [Klebsiella quasipneumoniae subsp. quasipneumoniae]|nr:hypothetical protein KAM645c_54900 [Klebsiella quasipneumoniae subsp. quasipneumoniae]